MKFMKEDSEEWMIDTSLGFPFWIVLNSEVKTEASSRRNLFLLIRNQEFNERDLRKIFTKLAEVYLEPENLFIIASSDENIIKRAIRQHSSQVICVRFPDAPEAMKDYEIWPGQKSSGYYRSHYVRVDGEEWFAYNPNPEEENMVIAVIKERSIAYTGESDSDLLLAIREGNTKQVQEFLSRGAEVNAKDERGKSALMLAVLYSSKELFKTLMAKRANVNVQSNDGSTALIYAAADTNKEMAEALLASGADVNTSDKDGYTPLILASMNGNADIVKTLLAKGADINAKTNRGRTSLSLAKGNNHTEVVELLSRAGAKE